MRRRGGGTTKNKINTEFNVNILSSYKLLTALDYYQKPYYVHGVGWWVGRDWGGDGGTTKNEINTEFNVDILSSYKIGNQYMSVHTQ